MSLRKINKDLYLKCRISELEDHFTLYEIHSDMVRSNEEMGSEVIYIHEYPLTIQAVKEEIRQIKERLILLRDAILKKYPEVKAIIREKCILDL
jgi:hypothetical protein